MKSARYKVTIGISMCPARKDEGVARASSNCQNSPKFALDTIHKRAASDAQWGE